MGKGFWKDYFSFTIRERSAVLVLLLIIVVFIFLPGFFAPKFKDVTVDAALQRRLDSITSALHKTAPDQNPNIADFSPGQSNAASLPGLHPFDFDPNSLPPEGFKQMGLRDKTIQTILNYRNKGGVFKQADDIKKIYGLTQAEAEQIIPFVKVEGNTAPAIQDGVIAPGPNKDPIKSYQTIDINTATEEDWKSLPGIGDVLSKRIVKFRSAVHGFKSVEDVKKTYGLSDSAYQVIFPYLTIGENSAEN